MVLSATGNLRALISGLVLTIVGQASLRGFLSGGLQTADGGFENPDNVRPYAGYTQLDARVGIRNDRMRLSVYGRNLTDKTYVTNLVNTNEFYSDPRVVGVELGLEF